MGYKGSYLNIPKAIFYLLKGDYRIEGAGVGTCLEPATIRFISARGSKQNLRSESASKRTVAENTKWQLALRCHGFVILASGFEDLLPHPGKTLQQLCLAGTSLALFMLAGRLGPVACSTATCNI